MHNQKNKAKKFLIKSFSKNIKLKQKFSNNMINAGGANSVAKGLKALINLSSLNINLY
jgi:hypothetical protein